MIDPFQDYDQAYADFRWDVPQHLNMAAQVCDVWCERDPGKTAIIDATDLGNIKNYTYADLSRAADTLAHHLKGLGIVQEIGSVCCAVRTYGPPPRISRFGNWGPFRSHCSNCLGQKPCHHVC